MTDDKKLCKRCGLTIHRSPYGSWIHSETTEAPDTRAA